MAAPNTDELVLPRPGAKLSSPQSPIPGPTEAHFTKTFGALLPPAKYLTTATGRAAYYEILPSASSTEEAAKGPDRVLFIHGVQTPALGMLPLARALQPSFPNAHLVLLDLWGHGLSDTPIVPHTPGLFHALLDALLDHLGWPTVHLVGFSFGGALTIGFAASRLLRVKSYTIVAPAGLIQSSGFTDEERGYMRGGDEAAARRWVVEWLEGGELEVPSDWEERVERGEVVAQAIKAWQMREHPGHTASVVAIVRDGGVVDNEAMFARALGTGVPSLGVVGEKDFVCGEKELKDIGFERVFVVPEAGHGVVRENVPEVAGHIADFWSTLEADDSQ